MSNGSAILLGAAISIMFALVISRMIMRAIDKAAQRHAKEIVRKRIESELAWRKVMDEIRK